MKVESDNALLVDILKNGLTGNNNIAELRLIHTWVSKNLQVRISLISKNNNKVANCIAKEARGNLDQLSIFYDSPIIVR